MTSPTARRRPPGRYDEPSLVHQRVLAIVLAGMVVALLAAVVSFFLDRFRGDRLQGQVTGFEIRSDSSLEMQVEVAKQPGRPVYCVIRARGERGLEVGRDVAVVDAVGTDGRTASGSFVLATTERAVTAELAGCTTNRISRDDPAP